MSEARSTGGGVGHFHLGRGETVFTRDGHRLGKIDNVTDQAFRVARTHEHDSYWLRREAIARTTMGGLVFLVAALEDVDAWRWDA